MKTMHYLRIAYISAILICFTACDNEQVEEHLSNDIKSAEVVMPPFELGTTSSRANLNITSAGLSLAWEKNDVLGIFPDKGDQVGFSMSAGSGSSTATFTGGGWALKNNSIYYAYYPFNRECYAGEYMKNQIPFSLPQQVQNGNNNTEHLGKSLAMRATGVTPESGKVTLRMEHLMTILRLDLNLPVADNVTSVSIATEENNFYTQGTFDLQNPTAGITPTDGNATSSVTLYCQNLQATTNNPISVYLALPQVDLTGKWISVTVVTENNGELCQGFEPSQSWEAGVYYTKELSFALPQTPLSISLSVTQDEAYYNGIKLLVTADIHTDENAPILESWMEVNGMRIEGLSYELIFQGISWSTSPINDFMTHSMLEREIKAYARNKNESVETSMSIYSLHDGPNNPPVEALPDW